jgi:hypothetical protein
VGVGGVLVAWSCYGLLGFSLLGLSGSLAFLGMLAVCHF